MTIGDHMLYENPHVPLHLCKKVDILRVYIERTFQSNWTELNLGSKLLEGSPNYDPTLKNICKGYTLTEENYKDTFAKTCCKFINKILLNEKIVYVRNKKDSLGFWSQIFHIADEKLDFKDQPFYQILACFPVKFIVKAEFHSTELLFLNELVKAYFLACFFSHFTDKQYFENDYNSLAKLFKTSRLLTKQNLDILGYSKDDIWLLALSRWYKANNDELFFEYFTGGNVLEEMKSLNPYDENVVCADANQKPYVAGKGERYDSGKKYIPDINYSSNLNVLLGPNDEKFKFLQSRVFYKDSCKSLQDCIFGPPEYKTYLGLNSKPMIGKIIL